MGISKSYLKELAEKKKYQSGGFSTQDKQFSVKKSTIPGANKGLFSKTPIKQGKLIGLAHENNQPIGTLGNMHNHSETPNMQSVKVGNQRYVYATRDIQPGEELTTNYRLQPELEQPEDFMGNKRFGQKGFYKPDFRTKSQIAAQQGNTSESTKVAPKINPVDMRKAQEAAMQRAIANQPTFRQGRTLSASEQAENQARLAKIREQQEEEENRRRLTFTGNAEARGAGTLMQPLLDVINPFSYYYSGKDAVRGLGQAAEGVTNLNLGQIGSGLAGATLGALGAIPVTSEFKPLFGAAGKTFAKPALKAASNLGKPGVSRNLADLQAAKKFAKQYGYELPKNLKRVAESDVLTDRTIRGLMNRHNTVARGVSTNWDEIQKHVPFDVWDDIVKNFEKEGIDYINNPKAAAEYMATHIPVRTGYGRVGLKPGEDALYLSNSMPTAEGYTYGHGYAVKAKRPTDFSSANRQDWIKANEFPVSYGFKNSPFGTGIVKSDYAKRVPTSLRDVAYAAGDPSIIQNAIKKSEEAYDLARTRHSNLQQKYVDKMWNRRLDFIKKNNPELLGKGSIWDYKMPLADRAKELYYNSLLGASNISKELSGIPPIVGGVLDKRNMAALGKNLFSPIFGKMDPYAHYIIKGTPGEKVLEPVRSVKITPEMWSNQSRAHVGKYSRGLTRRELGGTIPAKTYQNGGTDTDASYMNFVRTLPPNLAQPNDPSYNLRGYWNALGNPESFDYNQPTDDQGYYHAFSRDPRTGQILKAPFHPSFKEGVNEEGAYRLVSPRGDIYTQGFKYPAYEGPYALPKMDQSYDFLDKPNYEGYFDGGGKKRKVYKPDFRTKSQIANTQGQQRENTSVNPVVKNAAQLQRINQIQEQERQRRIKEAADRVQGTLRETNDADREAMNREDYTLLGRAQKLGTGDFNPLVVAAGAADLINPAAYWYIGKDFGRGIGQTAQGVVNLDPQQIGSGLLQTTLSGLMLFPAASVVKPALKGAGKYLTTQTPLRNAYNLIPEGTFSGYSKLKNPNKSYRVAGMDAYDDFIESGVLRSKQQGVPEGATFAERIMNRPTGFPSFQKGYADLRYLPEKGGVVFETSLPTFKRGEINPVTGQLIRGRHYAHRVIDPQTGTAMGSIPGENISVYASQPHWLKGYPQLNTSLKKYGGIIPQGTYQGGGTIGIPGVDGQVVSSGPQPLTSVKKTRGPISKDEKGDVKTMSNKQVKKILKNIK